VHTYGDELLQDPRRVRALLYDTCPGYRRELTVLVAAAEEDVPVQIRRSSDPVSLRGGLERFAADLEDNRGLNRDAARWAVAAWAWALGAGPLPAEEDPPLAGTQVSDGPPPPPPPPPPPRGSLEEARSRLANPHKTIRWQILAGAILLAGGLFLPLSSYSFGGSFRLVPDGPQLAFAVAVTAVAALLSAAVLSRPERLPAAGSFTFGLGLYAIAFFFFSLGYDLTDEDTSPAVGVFLAIAGGILLVVAGLRGLLRAQQHPAAGPLSGAVPGRSGLALAVAGATLLMAGGFVPWGESSSSTYSSSFWWVLIPSALVAITVAALILSQKASYRSCAIWLLLAGALQAAPIVLLILDGAWPLAIPAALIVVSGLIAYAQVRGSVNRKAAPGSAESPPTNAAS
jgi:hypothetical protein